MITSIDRWQHVKDIRQEDGKKYAWKIVWSLFEPIERKQLWQQMSDNERNDLFCALDDCIEKYDCLVDVETNNNVLKSLRLIKLEQIKSLCGIETYQEAYEKLGYFIVI